MYFCNCRNSDKGTKEGRRENKLLEKYKKRSCHWHKLLTCYPLNSKTKKNNQSLIREKYYISFHRNPEKVSPTVWEMNIPSFTFQVPSGGVYSKVFINFQYNYILKYNFLTIMVQNLKINAHAPVGDAKKAVQK